MLMQMIAWSYNQAENTLWSSFYQDQAKLSNLDNYSNIFIVLTAGPTTACLKTLITALPAACTCFDNN